MSFRRILYVFTIVALLSLLFTCRMDTGFGSASPARLPEDKVLDVARSFSGPFAYETLLPVALNLTVDLFRQPSPAAALERQAAGGQLIVVSLWNRKGEALYSGTIPPGGTLATVLSLPAAPQEVVLRLESPGYQSREVTIGGMVLYSEINRVMGLLSEGLPAKGLLPDSDKDGVPDIYDVDPLDPEVAFQVRTPASGQFTVAFEDLFPVPGDADYNDFVAKYFVLENHKSEIKKEPVELVEMQPIEPIEVMLLNLHGEATANAKIAGYSHKFGIVIDFPGHTALQVRRVYYDGSGTQRTDTQVDVADKAVIWLFENTSKYVAGKTATFDIFFPKGMTRNMVSIAPYDPVLYVLNTNKDIHLVGRDSLSGQELSYMDANGYPWGLLVPEDWQHPAETQYIGKAYPLFDEWRASKGAVASYWYLYPASTGSVPGNNPPSKVSSPDSTELVAGHNLTQPFHLISVDPDPGDTVEFMSSPAPVALQDLFSLDTVNGIGLVSFKPNVPEGDYLFYFWSVDNHGASTITTPFKVTFQFRSKASSNNPPSASFPPRGYGTSGAGIEAANGYFVQDGIFNLFPIYFQTGGSYRIFKFFNNGSPRWGIDTVLPEPSTVTVAFTAIPYYTVNAVLPPESVWTTGAVNAGLAPSVFRVPISGNPIVSSLLTGHYIFSDPDGDSEVGSHYQWYRFANSTDADTSLATPIGSDAKTYAPIADDINKWLRLQVTPVDEHGAVGAPVLSDAVQVIVES